MVIENIAEYMNARANKKFSKYEVNAINRAIYQEFYNRKEKDIEIRSRTKEGKEFINKRIVEIVKNKYSHNITAEDVVLFKHCRADEYSDRTGKCAWGFSHVREKLGYDPNTGLEIN